MKKLKRFLVTAIVSAVAITMSAQSADTVKKGRIIDSATGKATEVALPYNPIDDGGMPYYIEREKAIEIAMSQFGNSASCDYYASLSGCKLITDPKVCYGLRRAAKGSTHVLITGVTNTSVQKDFLMRNGESRMTIYTSNYPKGTYLVTIMEDGEILDTKTVVK